MKKKWLVAVFVAALIGIGLSYISISEYFSIQKSGLENQSFCTVNNFINCDLVNASSYSTLFGIPVAGWGLLFYIASAAFALFVKLSKSNKDAALSLIWVISIVGVVWALRMAYVSIFVLNAICLTCLSEYVVTIFIMIALFAASGPSIKERVGLLFSKKVISPAITAAIIFGLGYLFTLSATSSAGQSPTAKEINELVAAHMRQSLYDIKPEDIKDAPVWGNPEAKTTIVEFSDFQCPFCRAAAFNIKPYLQEYRKNVKFVFLNYPLDNSCNKYIERPMHANACLAAKAAVCAQEKEKFWEVHDGIFKNQNKIKKETLVSLAEKNGIDKAWMGTCIDSPEALAKVQADIEVAHHIYLSGTPSVFINQRALRYWKVPEIMRPIIEEEIKRAK